MKSLRTIALKEAQNRVSPDVTAPSTKISEFFGSNVFDKKKMKDYLSKEVFQKLISSIDQGELINHEDANHIATAMKSWAYLILPEHTPIKPTILHCNKKIPTLQE